MNRFLLVSVIASCLSSSLAAQAPPVAGTVPLTPPGSLIDNTKGNAVHFQLTPIAPIFVESVLGAYLFAPNNPGLRLSVVYLPTSTLVSEIPTGPGVVAIAQRPGTGELWAVDTLTHSVSVIDAVRQVITRTIQVGREPHGIAFTASGDRAYVACAGSNTVDVVDAATYSVAVSLAVPCMSPRGIAVLGGRCWVAPFYSGNNTTTRAIVAAPDPHAVQRVVDISTVAGATSLPDRDLIAIQTTATPATDFVDATQTRTGLGTTLLNVHARPGTNELWIPNTDALNGAVRGEKNFVGGQVVRNRVTVVDVVANTTNVIDLDAFSAPFNVGFAQPAAVCFDVPRNRAYVAAFGSDRIAVLDATTRLPLGWYTLAPLTPPMPASATSPLTPARCGPRGLWLAPSGAELYVFNQLDDSFSRIDLVATPLAGGAAPVATSLGFDPTPANVKRGLGHLANADLSLSRTSSCFSCHVDGHYDQLAWDLAKFLDPQGTASASLTYERDDKGPMTTQSLRGLRELAPFHWRGEQRALADFNGAFVDLLKRATPLTSEQFAELEAATFSLVYPANQRQDPARTYTGAAAAGLNVYQNTATLGALRCGDCHALPFGSSAQLVNEINGPPARSFKVAQLRDVAGKLSPAFNVGGGIGMRTDIGFGLLHSATIESLPSFVGNPPFSTLPSDVPLLAAFLEKFDSGLAPATGWQRTIDAANVGTLPTLYADIVGQAVQGNCDVVMYATMQIAPGVWMPLTGAYDHTTGLFQTPNAGVQVNYATIKAFVLAGNEVTLLGLPLGMGWRYGVDRDYDGLLDYDEFTAGTSWINPNTDGDRFPDGHEVSNGMNPLAFTAASPDVVPPTVNSPINVVWSTVNTVKLEFSTSEPCRATLSFFGLPLPNASPSPAVGGFDVNHSIVLPGIPPSTAGTAPTITINLVDPANNTRTANVNVATRPASEVMRVQSITNATYTPGATTLPFTVTVSGTLGTLPASGFANATIEAFAYYEDPSTGLALIPGWASISQLVNATAQSVFSVPLPATAGPGGKVHFGVRNILTGTSANAVGYVEGEDLVNFVTVQL